MDADLGSVEHEFGPNTEEHRSYKRGLGFVIAMGVVGLGIWIAGLINNQEFDWIVFVPSIAMLAISGKLLFMVQKSYSFNIEVCAKGLRIDGANGEFVFPWNEIDLFKESFHGEGENGLSELLVRRKDEVSHVLTSQLVASFDELCKLLKSAAKSNGISWQTAADSDQ